VSYRKSLLLPPSDSPDNLMFSSSHRVGQRSIESLLHLCARCRPNKPQAPERPDPVPYLAAACSVLRSSPDRSSSPCQPVPRGALARPVRLRHMAFRRHAAPEFPHLESLCRLNPVGGRLPRVANTSNETL